MKPIRWALLAALLLIPAGCGAMTDLRPGRAQASGEARTSPPEPPAQTEETPAPFAPDRAPEESAPEPGDGEFVRVTDYVPGIAVDLRYAAADNFTGQAIYAFRDAWLRYGTVKKLAAAQSALAERGYGLKIWDAFRPPAAQFVMWEICPDDDYVADPNRGFSNHSRGNTVDVTLTVPDGEDPAMPTQFDDFSGRADRDYSDVEDAAAVANALLLEQVMSDAGFQPYSGEWWHFVDSDAYDVEETFVPET